MYSAHSIYDDIENMQKRGEWFTVKIEHVWVINLIISNSFTNLMEFSF